jgi:hypothetical protein
MASMVGDVLTRAWPRIASEPINGEYLVITLNPKNNIFHLSAFQDVLLQYYKTHPRVIFISSVASCWNFGHVGEGSVAGFISVET